MPQTKPFLSYQQLYQLLLQRGFSLPDQATTELLLAQIGYYRLSGYWYPCRLFAAQSTDQHPVRLSQVKADTAFEQVIVLYHFDHKLRQLCLSALEHIELQFRALIAHELGQLDPLAWQKTDFIDPKQLQNFQQHGRSRNIWREWESKNEGLIARSHEECIRWHLSQQRALPFWVLVEAWDFGSMSKYFEILRGKYQHRISRRLDIKQPYLLVKWLHELNVLRNRCAHHSRIWNQKTLNTLPIPDFPEFFALQQYQAGKQRLFGLLLVIYFLLKKMSSKPEWGVEVSEHLATKPVLEEFSWAAMGIEKVEHLAIFSI